jgi:hypothetical protein
MYNKGAMKATRPLYQSILSGISMAVINPHRHTESDVI